MRMYGTGRCRMRTRRASHPCLVAAGAGGLIDGAWCLDTMAPVITALPARLTAETVTQSDLLVHRDGPVEVYYTPFDWVNTGARVVLVGICPGLHQMLLAVREARRVLLGGHCRARTEGRGRH